MRKFIQAVCSLLLLVLAPVNAIAQTSDETFANELCESTSRPSICRKHACESPQLEERFTAHSTGELGLARQAAKSQPQVSPARQATKSVTAVSDLAGDYVMTYQALVSTTYDGGRSVTVSAVDGTDSIAISGFMYSGVVVKACVNLSSMTISIPNQTLGYNTTYGYYDLALCTSTGSPDRSAQITGTISADGVISLDSWWGIFVLSGTYADYYFDLCYATEIEPANATMTYQVYYCGDTLTATFNVVAQQTDKMNLSVKNFYNIGQTVNVTLRSDRSADISIQKVCENSYGNWYCYAADYGGDYSTVEIGTAIVCDTATDYRTVSWNEWNACCAYGTSVYFSGDTLIGGQIDLQFDLTYPSSTTLQGSGTADSPYLIGSADEWNAFAVEYMAMSGDSLVEKSVKLTSDIDFTGIYIKPLGYDGYSTFNADLDGNGKTISGISLVIGEDYGAGLVRIAGDSAYVHDLTVAGELATDFSYHGGVVGLLCGTLSNVTSKVKITHSNVYYGIVGGLAGYAYGGTVTGCSYADTLSTVYVDTGGIVGIGYYATITDCVNTGCVAGRSYTGGIAGQLVYSDVINCYNTGEVSGYNQYTAGLIGYSGYGMVVEQCGNSGTVRHTGSVAKSYTSGLIGICYYGTYSDCYNTGSVTVADTSVSGCVAGLMASCNSGSTSKVFDITRCYNTADITSYSYSAGLVGTGLVYTVMNMTDCYNTGNVTSLMTDDGTNYTAGLSLNYYMMSSFNGCYNTGDVTASVGYVGGLFAYYKGTTSTSSYATVISNCWNSGKITSGDEMVGGLLAYQYRYASVDSCYNTGDVTGSSYVGGITGYFYDRGKYGYIANSWNSGNITATSQAAGGITGYCDFKNEIYNCFNTGNVTADYSHAGGIAGHGAAAFSNVYNSGTISGGTLIGGIIGDSKAGSYTTIDGAYSSGKVCATMDSAYVGNIIGVDIDNTSYWKSGNTITSSYYLSANAVECVDTGSVALSYAELAKLDLGDSWTAGDNYTYPRITSIADNDYARAYAAAVVPAEGDSYSSITTGFNVGTPDGVTWTASPDVVAFDGNTATFTETVNGAVTLTATCGDVAVTTEITCNVEVSGISDITGASREVVEERFYNLAGAQVAEPTEGTRAIYIVVKSYSDGITETVKEVR